MLGCLCSPVLSIFPKRTTATLGTFTLPGTQASKPGQSSCKPWVLPSSLPQQVQSHHSSKHVGGTLTLWARMLSRFSRIWLWDPVDCSSQGSSVHGILQARILEWVATSYSRGASWPRDWTRVSCISCTGRWILCHWATWEAQFFVE